MAGLIEKTLGFIDGGLGGEESHAVATMLPGPAGAGRTAWILSYTGVSNEPRVLRQAWSLIGANWNVVVVGFDGHSPRAPAWSFVRLADRARNATLPFRAGMWMQRAVGRLLYRRLQAVPPLAEIGARLYYFGLGNWRQNHRETLRLAAGAPQHLKPDLVIAHDFYTCPPALALAELSGAAFLVDCHEYGRGQYMDDPRWVADGRHFAIAMQNHYLARADAVTTVCDGIRDLLDAEQRLKRPVVTVRSTPLYEEQPFRPTADMVTVLYHGILSRDRGLEEAIASLAMWQPRFRLVLRGPGHDAFVSELKQLAAAHGVTSRLTLEPPVAFDRIVSAANGADIGYFVQHDFSPQKQLALPNKFFEYVMAGICLCVADLPEMAKLVERHRLGRVVSRCEPAAIAAVVNGLSSAEIDGFKRASLAAAHKLSWQEEQRVFLSLVEDIVTTRLRSPPRV